MSTVEKTESIKSATKLIEEALVEMENSRAQLDASFARLTEIAGKYEREAAEFIAMVCADLLRLDEEPLDTEAARNIGAFSLVEN
jgi:hypothetical protein